MTMEALGASTVALKNTYKATDDFIFESTLRPDILYNPSYLQVVKKIDLSPLNRSISAIKDLLSAFNDSCSQQYDACSQPDTGARIIQIPGQAMTVTDGLHLCQNLGDGYKLLELHRKEDVTQFISQTHKEKFSTPAAIYYDVRIHKFVYFSSNRPVNKQSAVYRFRGGDTIESYNYWDSYHDYV